jgi:hypothetical protein
MGNPKSYTFIKNDQVFHLVGEKALSGQSHGTCREMIISEFNLGDRHKLAGFLANESLGFHPSVEYKVYENYGLENERLLNDDDLQIMANKYLDESASDLAFDIEDEGNIGF